MDFLSASRDLMPQPMQSGKEYVNLSPALQDAYTAWTTSPVIGSFHFVADLPIIV
jgi:hypothetical protein